MSGYLLLLKFSLRMGLFEFRDKLVPVNCQFSGACLKAVTPAEQWLILGMISTTPLQRSDLYWTDLPSDWQTHEMRGRFELSLRTDIQNEDEKSRFATMCTEKIAPTLLPIHISNSYKTVRNVLNVFFISRSSLAVQYKQRGVRVCHIQEKSTIRIILWNINFPVVGCFFNKIRWDGREIWRREIRTLPGKETSWKQIIWKI